MWLWDNWNRPNRGWNWYFMVGWSSFVIAIGFFFMGAGVSPPRGRDCPTALMVDIRLRRRDQGFIQSFWGKRGLVMRG